MPNNFGPYQPYTGFSANTSVDWAGGFWGWGNNNYGEIGQDTTKKLNPFRILNSTGSKVMSFSVGIGSYNISFIKTDGTLWTYGYNNTGQLGNGTVSINYSSPIQIGSLTNWTQVAGGQYHIASIKTDGTLWTWGNNQYGQLGNQTTVYYSSPIQVGSLTNWKLVACGGNYTASIKTDGTLWTWGYNGYGQLGNGTTTNYSSPIQVGTLNNWSKIACGNYATAAIKTDGTLWCWGIDQTGSLGLGVNGVSYSSPVQVGSLTNWSYINIGQMLTSAIKTDGTLWGWGPNTTGILGNGTSIAYSSPVQIGSLTNWKKIVFGGYSASAIKTDGTLWAWGQNGYGTFGNGSTSSINVLSPVQIGSLNTWTDISGGSVDIYATADPYYAQDLGQRYLTKDYLLDVYPNIASQLGSRTSPRVFTFGANDFGQLGNGTVNIYYSSPIQVGSLTNWKQISSNYGLTSAIKTDGTLWSWGYNNYGQLGNGTTTNYSSPVQVGSLTTWKQVACGHSYILAIKTDGTLWSCGYNNYGQLGLGTISNSYITPTQSPYISNVKQVSAGVYCSAAIKTDGTLWTWGTNANGELGNGTSTNSSVPTKLGLLTNWKQVCANGDTMFAIKTDGTLWAWGRNDFGQLGNGTSTYYSSPIQIGSLTNWKQVGSGWYHGMALKTDGTLWTWGLNNGGQLGAGYSTSLKYSSPVQVGALTNWKQVAGGGIFSTAIKTDGTLWTWGYNGYGQLGNQAPININYSSPIQVGTSTSWKQVSCGYYHTSTISDGYI